MLFGLYLTFPWPIEESKRFVLDEAGEFDCSFRGDHLDHVRALLHMVRALPHLHRYWGCVCRVRFPRDRVT